MSNGPTIVLATEAGIERIQLNGTGLGTALQNKLGYTPTAAQVRVNGVEFMGRLDDFQVEDGAMVQVLAPAVAQKGVAGACGCGQVLRESLWDEQRRLQAEAREQEKATAEAAQAWMRSNITSSERELVTAGAR